MTKTIKWIGGIVFLGAIGIATLIAVGTDAEAEEGWPTFIRRAAVDSTEIEAPQKPCFANWAKGVWPTIVLVDFSSAVCTQSEKSVSCDGSETPTYTAEEFVTAEAAGDVSHKDIDVITNNEAKAPKKTIKAVLTSEQLAGLAVCIEEVWPFVNGELLHQFYLWRDDTVYGNIYAWIHYHSTANSNDYLDLIAAGLIVQRTGTVDAE